MNISFRIKLTLFFGLIAGFVLLYFVLLGSPDKRNIHIIFRYDDFSNHSSELIESRILGVIQKQGNSCSFGIIPFEPLIEDGSELTVIPLDTGKSDLIMDYVGNGSLEVCLHGYQHIQYPQSSVKTEFKGMPAQQQEYRIKKAKYLLDSIFDMNVLTFIPPWNSYDQNTLQILSDLGFHFISGDNIQPVFKESSQVFVPFTATLTELSEVLKQNVIPSGKEAAFVTLMVHDYDFEEVDQDQAITDLESFDEVMQEVTQRGWGVSSISNAVKGVSFFNSSLYRYNRKKALLLDHMSMITTRIGLFKKLKYLNAYYLPKAHIIGICMMVVILYSFVALVLAEMVGILLRRITIHERPIIVAMILLLLLTIVSLLYFWTDDQIIGKNELRTLIALAGILFGLYSVWRYKKHESEKFP